MKPNDPDPLTKLADVIKQWVAFALPKLAPDDDLPPSCVFLPAYGTMPDVLQFPHIMQNTVAGKNLMAAMMASRAASIGAIGAAFLVTSLFRVAALAEREETETLHGDPKAVEGILICEYRPDRLNMHFGAIVRHPRSAPTIKAWRDIGTYPVADRRDDEDDRFGRRLYPILTTNLARLNN